MRRLHWKSTRAVLMPGSVKPNMTDAELEKVRARLLVGRDLAKGLRLPVFPHDFESQVVELELLWEKEDPRSKLELQFVFSFDHLMHSNC